MQQKTLDIKIPEMNGIGLSTQPPIISVNL
jgi:hypothetical protein